MAGIRSQQSSFCIRKQLVGVRYKETGPIEFMKTDIKYNYTGGTEVSHVLLVENLQDGSDRENSRSKSVNVCKFIIVKLIDVEKRYVTNIIDCWTMRTLHFHARWKVSEASRKFQGFHKYEMMTKLATFLSHGSLITKNSEYQPTVSPLRNVTIEQCA